MNITRLARESSYHRYFVLELNTFCQIDDVGVLGYVAAQGNALRTGELTWAIAGTLPVITCMMVALMCPKPSKWLLAVSR